MNDVDTKMRSIWYLVGLILLVMGGLVAAAAIAEVLSPPARSTVLANLRPGLWWGGVMIVAGVAFVVSERRRNR